MKKNPSQHNTSAAPLIIYGRHAVLAALQNPRRKIQKLLITAENRTEIAKIAPHIAPVIADKKDFSRILPQDAVHQGFALYCSRLETYNLDDILALAENNPRCRVLLLDQVRK